MNIPFVKMHANGNDFVIIDCRTNNFKFDKSQISRLSNRHTGIGCDQFILLEKSQKRDIFMKIFNPDGAEAKMCGNAAICVSSLIFASKKTNSISIETISSDLTASLNVDGKISVSIKLPAQVFKNMLKKDQVNVHNINFAKIHPDLNSGILVNMGNPHIVFIVQKLENLDLLKYGEKIEKNELFSDGINVGIVEIVNRNNLKIKFWERGAGLTLSCGSGILSSFYACYKKGLCDAKSNIIIPNGKVTTSIKDDILTISTIATVSFLGEFSNE